MTFEYNKNYMTSEFRTTIFLLILAFLLLFYLQNLTLWAYAISITVIGYIISRSRFKKNRGAIYRRNGFKTSEFLVMCLGFLLLILGCIFKKLALDMTFLCFCSMQFVFNYSRGEVKSLNDTKIKVEPW